jgi:hypothetical protein
MDKSKIAILTTVANFELFQITSVFFPEGIQKYVIDGTNGMHGIASIKYMIHKLKNKGIKWLIMADEDVIFFNSDIVFSIIDQMEEQVITVCGARDGGVISHRNKNPYIINTFFSVLNFKDVLEAWNKKEMLQNQYLIDNEFNDDLDSLPELYNANSLYETYYCFYLWLRRLGKTFLFLDSKMDIDGISNYLEYKGESFLCHTWYARSYKQNKKHTARINKHLLKKHGKSVDKLKPQPIIYKHKTFYFTRKIKKYYKRVMMKLN